MKTIAEKNWRNSFLKETGIWLTSRLISKYAACDSVFLSCQVTTEDVDAIYELAKFYFECGQYVLSSPLLRRFLELNADPQKELSALWGKIASDLAMGEWSEGTHLYSFVSLVVVDNFARLETLIESTSVPLKQLQLRTWAAHWSLFAFFQIPQKESYHVDLLLGNDK